MRRTMILICLMVGMRVYGQQVYSLRSCIELGLSRNYAIRIVQGEERITSNDVTLANAGYLPVLDINSGVSGIYNNETTKGTDGVSSAATVGSSTFEAGLGVSWTIFDGFGIQAEYARLKELRRLGELSTRITIEDFVSSVAAEYYNLIRQRIRLSNLRSSVNLSRERLRIVEERYNIGSMSRLDLQQAKVYFNADSSLLLTQLEVVHGSCIRLSELLALDSIDVEFRVTDAVIYPDAGLNAEELWSQTVSSNAQLLSQTRSLALSELDYKKVLSRNYPYVKLNANYGYTATSYGSGATDYWSQLGLTSGLTVGFTLFDGNRARERRNARIRIENNELRIEQLLSSLRAAHSNFWMSYRNNLELWTLEKENLIVAQENYVIAIERYKLGELSGIELREAQNSLLEAEERRSISEYNTKLCELSLLQLSGSLLSRILEAD